MTDSDLKPQLDRIESKLDRLLARKPNTKPPAEPSAIADEITRFVLSYWAQHKQPLSYRTLSRRFGRRASLANFPVDRLAEQKSEIAVVMNTRGGTFFYPSFVTPEEASAQMEDFDLTPEQQRDLQLAEERLLAGFKAEAEQKPE